MRITITIDRAIEERLRAVTEAMGFEHVPVAITTKSLFLDGLAAAEEDCEKTGTLKQPPMPIASRPTRAKGAQKRRSK